MSETQADTQSIQAAIRARVSSLGPAFKTMRPAAIIAVLGGAALWPVAAAFLGHGDAVSAIGQIPGANFISDFLMARATKADKEPGLASDVALRAEFERELLQRLEVGDSEAAALRADLSRLLQSVGGIEVALVAASSDVKETLVQGLAELGGSWSEFRWLLTEVQDNLLEIQAGQAEGLALQREQLDLLREQLGKTNLLLRKQELHRPLVVLEEEVGIKLEQAEVPCPYMGLEAFQPEDAPYFSGREELVADLLARLAESRFLAVVGPSGSGKSSLVRAGVVPALWAGALPGSKAWLVRILTPGEHPLEELAMRVSLLRGIASGSLLDDLRSDPRSLDLAIRQALLDEPDGVRLVLVVDQFEELFTLCRDEAERHLFIEALLHAGTGVGSRGAVIVAARADFYGRFARYPSFATAIQDSQVLVGPMQEEELRRAIEQPAAEAGLFLEPGLGNAIIGDLAEEPGALPLLSHALLETWKRRRGRTLTVAGYLESGGVRKAIAQSADRVYAERLSSPQQVIARSIFLRLTEPGEATEDTRRRASFEDLVSRPEEAAAVEAVVSILADERLLTTGEGTVEVSHEALIRHWPTLRRWLDEDREGLRLHRFLAQSARDWAQLGRDPGALYRGSRLLAANEWSGGHEMELNELEREFLVASHAAERSELTAATRRTRRLRTLALVLAVVLAIAVFLAGIAYHRGQEAATTARLATSRSLAGQAIANLNIRPDVATLLALEAYRADKSYEARNSLVASAKRLSYSAGILRDGGSSDDPADDAVAFSPDGKVLAAGRNDGTIQLWDVKGRTRLGPPLRGHDRIVYNVAFSPDGKTLASAGWDGTVRLWDVDHHVALGEPLRVHGTYFFGGGAFSHDGKFFVSPTDEVFRLWDMQARKPIGAPMRVGTTVGTVAFSHDGRILALGGEDGTVRLWDVAHRKPLGGPMRVGTTVRTVAFSPDGRILASGGEDGTVRLWDVAHRKPLGGPMRVGTTVRTVAFSPDGRILASGGRDGTVRLWDVARRVPLGPLLGHEGPLTAVNSVAFSPDGKLLVSASEDHSVRLWFVRDQTLLGESTGDPGNDAVSAALSPDGKTLLSGGTDGQLRLWDLERRRESGPPMRGHESAVERVSFSADGRTFASGGTDGTLRFWDAESGRPLGRPLRDAFVGSIAFSPDGNTLASGDLSVGVRLWSVSRRKPLGPPITSRVGISGSSVAFSPNGKLVAAGYPLHIWDIARQKLVGVQFYTEAEIVAFGPDGNTLAAASRDSILIRDVAREMTIGEPLSTHGSDVTALVFSPDGKTLIAGADDGTITLWDVPSRRRLGDPLLGHKSAVFLIAFNTDGTVLISASTERAVRWDAILWSTDLSAWQRRLCRIVGRSLSREEWSEFVPHEPYHETCSASRRS